MKNVKKSLKTIYNKQGMQKEQQKLMKANLLKENTIREMKKMDYGSQECLSKQVKEKEILT